MIKCFSSWLVESKIVMKGKEKVVFSLLRIPLVNHKQEKLAS